MDRYEDARPIIENLLLSDPQDPETLYLMGVVYLSREQYTEARELVQEALRNGYNPEYAFFFIGLTYQEQKMYAEAEDAYLRSLEINPNQANVNAAYGYLMLLTGHDEKAIKLLDEAIRIDPDDSAVNDYVYRFYLAKNDGSNQAQYLQRTMEIARNEQEKLINIAVYHLVKEDTKTAEEYLRQLYLLDPTNKHVLEVLEEINRTNHMLFLPNRLIDKIGGPAVFYIGFIILVLVLTWADINSIAIVILALYLITAGYTWLAPLLYRLFVKGKI
nr:tetratricopeptide repeat protein [Ornithinibacillus caprae]